MRLRRRFAYHRAICEKVELTTCPLCEPHSLLACAHQPSCRLAGPPGSICSKPRGHFGAHLLRMPNGMRSVEWDGEARESWQVDVDDERFEILWRSWGSPRGALSPWYCMHRVDRRVRRVQLALL